MLKKILICLMINCTTFTFHIKPKLSDYKRNIYSQFGEDGIIEKIFEIIGVTSKIVIEFAANDGFSCSNTANLWSKDSSWKGILIESNANSFKKLIKNVAPYNCVALNRIVGSSNHDSLEVILKQENITDQIDLLSIDIDGNDYYIFQSLKTLRPRVIICEYNPSIPAYLDVYPHENNYIGCSVAALQRVGKEKGYSLIAITTTNCFFVQNQYFSKFANYETDLEHIKINNYISYIISDYSGRYKIIAPKNFKHAWGWNGLASSHICKGECITINRKII